MHIRITKGLNIPILGAPKPDGHPLILSGAASALPHPDQIALSLKEFEDVKFQLLVKTGDHVQLGQPLLEDKSCPGKMLVSPAGGTVVEIRRGLKRVLQAIIIQVEREEKVLIYPSLDPTNCSKDELIDRLKISGIFPYIRSRPFNQLADPYKPPRSIFVKAVESAPFIPDPKMQVEGFETEFQQGLNILTRLTDGPVHLVYHKESNFKPFVNATNVQKHTVEGPHPVSNPSVHIQWIDRITTPDTVIWCLDARTVVAIGYLFTRGSYFVNRVIGIGGPAILPDRTGYFKARNGYPVHAMISGRLEKGVIRLISGDPLNGHRVSNDDFLGFNDYVFCAIPENLERQFLHFFRLGADKYSFSRAYLSGHFHNEDKEYEFTTNQHGEHRAFIDSTLYDKVMPLDVPTMLLVKAILAEDYDLATSLGLLEVVGEDFALPTFVCPSKMEMVDIVNQGLKAYAKEMV